MRKIFVPDVVYEALAKKAKSRGMSPDELATQIVLERCKEVIT